MIKAVPADSAANISQHQLKVELPARVEFLGLETSKSERPSLTDADVVISGGRALKSGENFEKLDFSASGETRCSCWCFSSCC